MKITIDIRQVLAAELRSPFGDDIGRLVLEALALIGYRTKRLGIGFVTRLLDCGSRFDAEEWLAEHDVFANYGADDLRLDRDTLRAIFG